MVLHDTVLEKHSPTLLAASPVPVVLLANRISRLMQFLRSMPREPLVEHFHGVCAILVLAALTFTLHGDTGRLMVDLHRGIRNVPMLATSAAAAAREDFKVVLPNEHLLGRRVFLLEHNHSDR
jgi:hypothetical protein